MTNNLCNGECGQSSLLTQSDALLAKKIGNVRPRSHFQASRYPFQAHGRFRAPRSCKRFQEPFPVRIIAKNLLTPITSAHQMINGSLILDAQLPRQAQHPNRTGPFMSVVRTDPIFLLTSSLPAPCLTKCRSRPDEAPASRKSGTVSAAD